MTTSALQDNQKALLRQIFDGELSHGLKTIFEGGNEQESLDALESFAAEKDKEIQDLVHHHYQVFVTL